jgi:hypothetical protein
MIAVGLDGKIVFLKNLAARHNVASIGFIRRSKTATSSLNFRFPGKTGM